MAYEGTVRVPSGRWMLHIGGHEMGERPFRVLGIQQIAVGSTDKAALR